MEKFGVEKRDILIERVEEARGSQSEASEQFESALEAFTSLTNFKGGALESQYNSMKKAYERSVDKADAVTKRINSVERVGKDLLIEWREEITQYSDPHLKRQSQAQLDHTKARFDLLLSNMRTAEKGMSPVLTAFNDRVLYLKHNLNASALKALRSDVGVVQADVALLVRQMQQSIQSADEFIKTIK